MAGTDRSFPEAVNHLIELYNADMLDECAEGAEELLQDYSLPLYHRMKVLILLADVQVEWELAESCLVRSEALWRYIRRANPAGADAATDKYLAEVRDLLDDLTRSIEEKKYEEMEWGDNNTTEDSVLDEQQKMDDEVADARARLEGVNFDADISNPDLMELDVKEANRSATPGIANDSAGEPDALTEGELSLPTVPDSGLLATSTAALPVASSTSSLQDGKTPKSRMRPSALNVSLANDVRDEARRLEPNSPAMMTKDWRSTARPPGPRKPFGQQSHAEHVGNREG